MLFSAGSGLAQWCHDQMVVRYGQAVHIREGELAEEPKTNVVDGDLFYCDLPLMDQAAAEDALATLSDENVLGLSLPMQSDVVEDPQPSYVEYHLCDHAEEDRTGCNVVSRYEGPVPSAGEWQPNVAYAVDDEVTYQGTTYICVLAHTSLVGWEPDVATTLWNPV